MIRLLSRVPRWLGVTLALVAAAAVFISAQLSHNLHGWQLVLTLSVGVVFAAIAVGLPQLDRWQAQRLHVRVKAELPELGIPVFADGEKVIDSLLAAEERECIASLPQGRPARPRGGFNAAKVAKQRGPADAKAGTDDDLKGLTLGDCLDLIEKEKSGKGLTAEDERRVLAAHEAMAPVTSAIKAFTASSFLSMRPDTRTPEQYREKVRQHLSDYREFLNDHLCGEYVTRNVGRFQLTLINPTDRVFEDVQVELYFPGCVRALDPSELVEPDATKPARPRPFGQGTPINLLPNIGIASNYAIDGPGVFAPRSRLNIDNSASARVTYPPVLLRPSAHIPLDEVVLIVEKPPRSTISGTWEATATNTEGRVKGSLTVNVATTPLAVHELLAEWSEAGAGS